MEKTHFILRQRYKAILKDGSEINLNLEPENTYYFNEQENTYIALALYSSDIDINQVKEIVKYFVPEETKEETKFTVYL